MARAVVYALVSCGQCNVETVARPKAKRPAPARQPTPHAGVPTPPRQATPPAGSPAARNPPRDTINTPTFRRADTQVDAPTRRKSPTSSVVTPRRPAAPTQQGLEVEKLIRQRLAVLDGGGDHFQLLGVAREANQSHIQKAYFALARQLHPDRLTALGVGDEAREAQRLFACVNTAFAVLSSDKRREEYLDILDRGGEAAVRAERDAAENMALRILESEESFKRGEAALRRDQIPLAIKELERAVELNGDEVDYRAMLAWAKFCGAPDKMAVGQATRRALHDAISQAPMSVTPKFYLGRVERMLGKDKAALELFEEVLEMQPHHSEATAEVRVLQSRIGGDKGGIFGRLKR